MAFLIAAGLLVVLLALMPPAALRRSRDRLAAEILARPGPPPLLLTPADRCTGRFRRVPGVLGLDRNAITFESRFESPAVLPLSQIRRVWSGSRTTSGRRLLRAEVLALVDMQERTLEFLMPRASVYQWRQYLGAWAARMKGEQT